MGRWRRRDREFPPPPSSQVHPGINSWKPLVETGELRLLSVGVDGGGENKDVDSAQE